LLQPSPVPANSIVDRLRTEGGRRALGIALALLVELLLLLLLLTLGTAERPGTNESTITVVNVRADELAEQAPEPASPEPVQRAEEPAEDRPVPERPAPQQPSPPRPAEPRPPRPAEPTAPPIIPIPYNLPSSAATPANPSPPAPPARRVYGPPDRRSSASRDTERVGTAPNGEPLYAAAWYREPKDEDLRAYLSTANGPGWGLIACRTVANFRVEDCVALEEYPEGSQINRAVLAAAWEFRVRPPQLGGRPLVGSWVRIRIDYSIRRQ
jgi:protein TonB